MDAKREEAIKRGMIKLLERLADDYERIDNLYLDSDLNPSHKASNDARIQELEKEARSIEYLFSRGS